MLKIKFIKEVEDGRLSIPEADIKFEFDADYGIEGVLTLFKEFLLACGFQHDNVKDITYRECDCQDVSKSKSAFDEYWESDAWDEPESLWEEDNEDDTDDRSDVDGNV